MIDEKFYFFPCSGDTQRNPDYSPLKFEFDQKGLLKEALKLKDELILCPPFKENIELRHLATHVASTEAHTSTPQFVKTIGNQYRIEMGYTPCLWTLNLKCIPGKLGKNNGSTRFRQKYSGEWIWDNNYEIPLIKSTVEALPFKHVDIVRLFFLPTGGFTPAHVDTHDCTWWDIENGETCTFILQSGAVPPVILETSEGALSVPQDLKAFAFRDCLLHGAPIVQQTKIFLRISGKTDSKEWLKIIDYDQAIWHDFLTDHELRRKFWIDKSSMKVLNTSSA